MHLLSCITHSQAHNTDTTEYKTNTHTQNKQLRENRETVAIYKKGRNEALQSKPNFLSQGGRLKSGYPQGENKENSIKAGSWKMQANRKKHSLQEIVTIAIRLGKTVFQNSKQFLESESGVAHDIPNYQVGIYSCYIRDVGGFVRQLRFRSPNHCS